MTTPSVPRVFDAFSRRLVEIAAGVDDEQAARDLTRAARLLTSWADKAEARLQQQLGRLVKLRAGLHGAGVDLELSPLIELLTRDEMILGEISQGAVESAIHAAQQSMVAAADEATDPDIRHSLRRALYNDLAEEILLEGS